MAGGILFYSVYLILRAEGEKRIIIGKISRRPTSISRARIIFEKIEYDAKFPEGPTAPMPGPILLRHATVAVIFVSIDSPSTDIRSTDAIIIAIYIEK